MSEVLAFVLGVIFGGVLGFFALALCRASADIKNRMREENNDDIK
jgi:hypothetical protein